jgi:DNA topoisomerase-3
MRLFIAEKPSLARAIADALPGPHARREGYIQCGGDDVVAWCAGHVLELATPDAYDPAFKQWRVEHLPIVPGEWKLAVTARDLLRTIKSLLPKASRVVHAGDPDREGQLLVDEVLAYLGYRGAVDRLLISDLNPPAVRKALGEIQSNARFRGLYEAALARQRADWLYGINLTRLYTLLGRAGGYDGVLSVGRVQTPLLGLVVRRDLEIEAFQPRPYFVVRATVRSPGGAFSATWQPPVGTGPGLLDESERLISRELADAVRARVAGARGVVARCSRERRKEPPPLPYALPDLQIDAGKRLGLGPKQVLDACQSLYETHRLLTYPRSDCSHLPEGQHAQAGAVLAAVAANVSSLAAPVGRADRSSRSRAWNDKKVTVHHAIIPTAVAKPGSALTTAERAVYELVARRYLAQFYPSLELDETKIEVRVGDDVFRASGRQTVVEGWRALVTEPPMEQESRERDGSDDDGSGQALPAVREGEGIECGEVAVLEKRTTPPKRFTESTLVQAMTGISRFVDDPSIKQLLRETDGIGTPATQAQIIETLFERRYIEKQGRQVVSTPVGRALVATLPEIATRPDMTALWEAAMRRIADGHMSLDAFLGGVRGQLVELVTAGRAQGALAVPAGAGSTPVRRGIRGGAPPRTRGSWPPRATRVARGQRGQ